MHEQMLGIKKFHAQKPEIYEKERKKRDKSVRRCGKAIEER